MADTEREPLRDTITAAFEQHVENVEAPAEPAAPVTPETPPTAEAQAETPEKPKGAGRTEGRARDAQGRLLPGPAVKEAKVEAPAAVAPVLEAPKGHGLARPSSWKKDYDQHWEKFDPAVAQYILQRESEAAKGVSAYKAEYDQAKPLKDAVAPFVPTLQQYGITPAKFITDMGETYRALATGTQEQRLGTLLRLAQDFQIPMQALFQQGQDGRVYFNPQVTPYRPQPQQQQPQAQGRDMDALIEQKLSERDVARQIQSFEAEAPTKYPHYETVKQTMVGLLQAELATDLADAYAQALRLPRHADIYEGIQKQEAAERAKRDAEEKAKAVASARAKTVSPKTSTPTAPAGSEKSKSVREALEKAWDTHAGGGRV